MRTLFSTIGLLALALGLNVAEARTPRGAHFMCDLTFKAKGGGVRLFIGNYELNGRGTITCYDSRGNIERLPVHVRLGGYPLSPSIGIGHMVVRGVASGVGFARSPYDFLGGYVVAGVHGALGVGGGLQLALHGTHRSLTLNGSLQLVRGVGFNAGFDYVEISELRRD